MLSTVQDKSFLNDVILTNSPGEKVPPQSITLAILPTLGFTTRSVNRRQLRLRIGLIHWRGHDDSHSMSVR